MRARLRPQQATGATAHQIDRVVSHRLQDREPFNTASAAGAERQRRARELNHLTRRVHTLGYTLIPEALSQPALAL